MRVNFCTSLVENNLSFTKFRIGNSFAKILCSDFIESTNLIETNIKYETLSNCFKDDKMIDLCFVNIHTISFDGGF